ncbi:MAG: RNA 2',3'-cyclic phosphodiesterase [bacterium]
MANMIRSFVAVDTAPEVKVEVASLVNRLREKCPFAVKWVQPEQMHITLAFLGEVSRDFIEKAKSGLRDVGKGFAPFSCQLGGLGAFPSFTRARVFWVGVKQGDMELKRLQKAIEEALCSVGYCPEKRAFIPHLTLGRLREERVMEVLNEISFQSSFYKIAEVTLFQSVLRPAGPLYIPLEPIPLTFR